MTTFENDALNGVLERADKIEAQLQRIADTLELLASVLQSQLQDRDATLNVQAVCYTQGN